MQERKKGSYFAALNDTILKGARALCAFFCPFQSRGTEVALEGGGTGARVGVPMPLSTRLFMCFSQKMT
ncbi:hypothetical protein BC940DRAFT_296282 [Gongronella butleri]|nr:hypothetical protein BC940DRAFT_296282 [Gongronella butleri]